VAQAEPYVATTHRLTTDRRTGQRGFASWIVNHRRPWTGQRHHLRERSCALVWLSGIETTTSARTATRPFAC